MIPINLLNRTVAGYREILGDLLTGFYVHGSVSFGCFDPVTSDIDFIAVVRKSPTVEIKTRLISLLTGLERLDEAPERGFEMSVVTESVCRDFVYPTPFELHYSDFYRVRATADPAAFCAEMHGVDYDLAAHFTVIKAVGIRLYGSEIDELFGEVGREYYIDSIRRDISAAESEITANPVYFTLNLCRVLAYLRSGLVLSKRSGGEWALRELPQFAPLICAALDGLRSGAMVAEDAKLREFAAFMLGEISV